MKSHESIENRAIEKASPALARLLSSLGERVAFPPDIPFQAAQARGKELNATIGQITDGRGGIVAPATVSAALGSLPPGERDRAMLYSPTEGILEVREAWRRRQQSQREAQETASTLPVATVGLTHGLSLVADLFGGPGRWVAVPSPFWGNYRQIFTARTGAGLVTAPAYRNGRYNSEAIAEALADLPVGEPAIAILNLPSNPGGYSPTAGERERIRASLLGVAKIRPLLVVCDDAYAGLVYEEGIPAASLFWELSGVHPNLIPVKVDGATKELSFFGGRLGFLTFPFESESEVAAALESKVKCLTRATVGSPPAATQIIVLQALKSEKTGAEIEEIRMRLGARYRVLKDALATINRKLLRPLPFNSGCFALLELDQSTGLIADDVRRHLLDHHDAGLIAIGDRHLRIAFCSVRRDALPELVRRLEQGVADLVAKASKS
jgi:aspartate/methionine/tyrosine aminotransferase